MFAVSFPPPTNTQQKNPGSWGGPAGIISSKADGLDSNNAKEKKITAK